MEDDKMHESVDDKEIVCECDHMCTSNCRRVGCNCECGEWHCEEGNKEQIYENHYDNN